MKRTICVAVAALLLALPAALCAADPATPVYDFPLADSLPDNPLMPDPFRKPDGTRVASLAEWSEQRVYLKALLRHYLYGHLPPRPAGNELSFTRLLDEAYAPSGSTVAGRKQVYQITISRNALTHSFRFSLWRPAELRRYRALINNYPEHSPANPGFSMAEGLRRGYRVGQFLAMFDYADEYFFDKTRGPSTFNVAPQSDTWRHDPAKHPLLIDWQVPTK